MHQRVPVSATGAYMGIAEHLFDRSFMRGLAGFFHERRAHSVLDCGAGNGAYAFNLHLAGIRMGCLDGNPSVNTLSKQRCFQADLAQEFDFGTRWDWVMSIEVAEHVPQAYETAYLNNLDRHSCKGIAA